MPGLDNSAMSILHVSLHQESLQDNYLGSLVRCISPVREGCTLSSQAAYTLILITDGIRHISSLTYREVKPSGCFPLHFKNHE